MPTPRPRLLLPLACALLTLWLTGTFAVRAQQPPAVGRLGITFINGGDVPPDDAEARYAAAASLGAAWTRWPLYWHDVEPEPGVFAWEKYDRVLAADRANRLGTNMILLGVPTFHRDGPRIAGVNAPVFSDGTDLPGPGKTINPANPWARYAYNAAARYRNGGDAALPAGPLVWEVWNEPDFTLFFQGGHAHYARMLKVAYLALKHADPTATVMFGGLTYSGAGENWLALVLDELYQDPAAPRFGFYFDAVAVHSYSAPWRSGWLVFYAQRTLASSGVPPKPVWLNESGVPVWDDYPGPTWANDDDDARARRASQQQQAAYLLQSTAYAFANGATSVFYHQLFDDCGDQAAGTNFPPHDGRLCRAGQACYGDAFGLFRNPASAICFSQHPQPGSARPVAEAYRLLGAVFGVPFSRQGIVEERADGLVTVTFARPASNERVVFAWNTLSSARTLSLRAGGPRAHVLTPGLPPRTLTPVDGAYSLALPPAEAGGRTRPDVAPFQGIGGMPLVLVEPLDARAATALLVQTFEVTPTPAPTVTPLPSGSLDVAAREALAAASPTGAVFVSLQYSRLRDAPTTEGSQVVGQLNPRQAASILGISADGGWLHIDGGGRRVWVAIFLGEVVGDLSAVPVVALPTRPAAAASATPEG